MKSEFLSKRLTLNTAAFWTEVSNYQATYSDASTSATYLTNAAKVRSRGIEGEAQIKPTANLNLYGSVTYAETVYLSYPNAPCSYGLTANCGLTGATLPNASRWSAALGGEYSLPLPVHTRRSMENGFGPREPHPRATQRLDAARSLTTTPDGRW